MKNKKRGLLTSLGAAAAALAFALGGASAAFAAPTTIDPDAKVNLNIVNVTTSEVVFSSQGAGEYELSNREIVGFGGTASYDSTLNGKVLDLAIREAVNNLVSGIETGAWRPAQ